MQGTGMQGLGRQGEVRQRKGGGRARGVEGCEGCMAVRGLPSTYVQAFMKAADRDGDGRVSLSEFQSFCDQREARLRTIFAKIDSDGDGKLTSDEIRAGAETLGVRISSEQLRVFVERLDTDRDSAITFSEFRSLLLLLPEVNPVAVFEVVVGFLFDFEAPLLRELCTSPREASSDIVAGLCSELREGTAPCSAR